MIIVTLQTDSCLGKGQTQAVSHLSDNRRKPWQGFSQKVSLAKYLPVASTITENNKAENPLLSLRQTTRSFTLVAWPEKTGFDAGRQQRYYQAG